MTTTIILFLVIFIITILILCYINHLFKKLYNLVNIRLTEFEKFININITEVINRSRRVSDVNDRLIQCINDNSIKVVNNNNKAIFSSIKELDDVLNNHIKSAELLKSKLKTAIEIKPTQSAKTKQDAETK